MHSVRNDPRSIFKQREESFRLHPRLDEQALLEGSAFLINRGRYTKGTKANPKSTRSLCLFLCSPSCLLWCRSALGGATWRLKYFRKVKRHDRVSVARWNHEFLVSRIERDAVDVEPGYLFNRNSPAGWNVAVVENAPNANGISSGASNNPSPSVKPPFVGRRRPESLARESRAAVCCFHWPCDRKSARPAGRFLSHRFRTFEHGGRPEIVVLKDDLVEIRIHRDRTVNRIPVGDRADRRTSDIDCRAGILRCGLNGSLL